MKKMQKVDYIWLFFFFAFFLMSWYKCQFGFANCDEGFYLATPYRLIQGDKLIVNEWHLSQSTFALAYPILKVYLFFANSTEGIFLAIRHVFTIFHAGTAAFIYLKLRKINYGACFASLIYLVFVPHGIMTFWYNTMGLGLITISCILLYTNTNPKMYVYFLSGLAFAGAVLCCPYLVILYFLYGIVNLVSRFGKAKHTELDRLMNFRGFLMFTVACACAAIGFFVFLLKNMSLLEMENYIENAIHSVWYIVDDPDHPDKNIFYAMFWYIGRILFEGNDFAPSILTLALALILMIYHDNNREKHKKSDFILISALTVIYMLPYIISKPIINYYMFPPVIMGLFCFAYNGRQNLREFVFLWIPSMVYGFCLCWTSNQGFFVISTGAALATMGSMLMLVAFCKQTDEEQKSAIYRIISVGLLSAFVITVALVRWNTSFWDGNISDLTAEITVGAEKGIHTTPEKKETYESIYYDSETVREFNGETVLYYTMNTWMYLDDPKSNASFSAWIGGGEHTAKKLVKYYEINQDKIPDIAYGLKADWEDAGQLLAYFDEIGYEKQETEQGYIFIRQQAENK